MQIFKLDEKTQVVCQSEGTRYGFRHLATLMVNGQEMEKNKCCYYNRTWESWQFQSVVMGLIEKTKFLTEKEKIESKLLLNK